MPKYFIILYTGTELWYEYIAWLNKNYKENWGGDDIGYYYGYTGRVSTHGTHHSNTLINFENSPEIITLEQWDQWVNNKETNYSIY